MREHRLAESSLSPSVSRPRLFVRAPLLVPALVFATGCACGSSSTSLFLPGLAMTAFLGALWVRFRRRGSSLLPFLGTVLFLGVAAASFHLGWRPVDDLRRLPQAKFRAECRWQGTIQSVPVEKEREGASATTAILAIRRVWISGTWRPASGRVLLEVRSAPAGAIVLSQSLCVRGSLRRPGEPRNPGDPDWRKILSVRHIAYRLRASWSEVQPLDTGSWLGREIAAARRWASRLLRTGIEGDPEAAALLAGMIYGQTGGLPAKTEEEFRLAGAYHIFAVSGQNVGAVLAVGLALFEAGRVSRWRWGWALLPVVISYALLSGGSASVGRAALLSSLVLIAWLLRRPIHLLNLWGLSLLLFLTLDPLSVGDVSLQLSFGVVLALLLLSAPLSRWMAAPFRPDPLIPRILLPRTARVMEGLGAGSAFLLAPSLAASLGAFPFEVIHFHFVSLVGPLANLLVVPLAELAVTAGTLSLCFGSLWSTLSALLNNANWLFARSLLATVAFASHLPAAGIATADPSTLLSRSSRLHLLFPAIPLGSACLIRSEGRVFLVHGGESRVCLTKVEPIRRFYGWNWLDGELRGEGESWVAAPRRPWGSGRPLVPFEQLCPTASLCLQPIFDAAQREEWSDASSVLLIVAERLPLLALALTSPSGGATPQATMNLFIRPTKESPTERLCLALKPGGAWLGNPRSRNQPGSVRRLGDSAIEVRLGLDQIDFRPYRGEPISYPIRPVPEEEGATNQTPSSPEGTVQ
ncbi:ComEC/Rec2 family competence protein [Methylacidimicrobium sp. B4]|uniref:ComEC/Rec2 family competence protein n=1 Tax=Methylacidimicrobium sp. B4 TaxID=2796139 RepID=UPI001A8DA49D|nr:ComEC/Rec2 family competence protein [Methylacidimicrobium sp. B4]QSR84024.1 ComEC family competence protein [Methylacidimicrobium sp. B4]